MKVLREVRRHLAAWFCSRSERAYRRTFAVSRAASGEERAVPLTVLMFAGHSQMPLLVASLRSFVGNVGRPRQTLVGSDGSLDARDEQVLKQIDPTLVVVTPSADGGGRHPDLAAYAEAELWGRKLSTIVTTNEDTAGPLLYFDTDVLFLPAARALWRELDAHDAPGYMEEPNRGAFDDRWNVGTEKLANAGFLYFPESLDWTTALGEHGWLMESPTHRSEQTILNLVLRDAGAEPLDPEHFVLDYRDGRAFDDLAWDRAAMVRHYVAPIRWKFWVRVAGGWTRALASVLSGRWLGSEQLSGGSAA
jgi:hypothetical protein